MESTLAEYELTEVLVRRQQDSAQFEALLKDSLIIDTGCEFRDKPNIVPIGAETVNDLPVDAFVGDDLHPATFSAG